MDTQPKRMNGSFDVANESFATQNVLFGDLELTGKRIKSMRENCGLSIEKWAKLAGHGVATQHDIEHGTCNNMQMVFAAWEAFPKILPKRQEDINEATKIYLLVRRTA